MDISANETREREKKMYIVIVKGGNLAFRQNGFRDKNILV